MTSYAVLVAAEARLDTFVESVDKSDLDRPTPCAGWDVRALLGHTLAGIEAFAAAADGEPGPSAAEMFGGQLTDDPVVAARRATDRSRAAWHDLPDPDAMLTTVLGPLPAGLTMSISAFATLVHTWDLAIATGRDALTELPPELLEHASTVAHRLVPDLRGAGSDLFQPELPAPPDATPTQRLMAFLGRVAAR